MPDCNTVARIPRKCKLPTQHIFGTRNLSDKVLFPFSTLCMGPVSGGDCRDRAGTVTHCTSAEI